MKLNANRLMMKTNVNDLQTLQSRVKSHTTSLPHFMATNEIQRNHRKLDHLQFLCGYLIKILSNFSFRFLFYFLFVLDSCFCSYFSFFALCVCVCVVLVAVDFGVLLLLMWLLFFPHFSRCRWRYCSLKRLPLLSSAHPYASITATRNTIYQVKCCREMKYSWDTLNQGVA